MTRCWCGEREVDVEHATYVILGTPACSRDCYIDALEAQNPSTENIVMVTYRKPQQCTS